MNNLDRLEHNLKNLEIKTLLTKSFYDAYNDKDEDTTMSWFIPSSALNDDTYISNSTCTSKSNLYKQMICEHPEYKPYSSKNKENKEINNDVYITAVRTKRNPHPF